MNLYIKNWFWRSFILAYAICIVYLRGTGTNDYNKQFKLI